MASDICVPKHDHIYQSDVFFVWRSRRNPSRLLFDTSHRLDEPATGHSLAGCIRAYPPPVYRPESILNPLTETVKHHLPGTGEFSTGDLGK